MGGPISVAKNGHDSVILEFALLVKLTHLLIIVAHQLHVDNFLSLFSDLAIFLGPHFQHGWDL